MTPFEIAVATSGTTVILVGFVLWLARNLIQERLRGAVKHDYDTKLEAFRSDLRKETEIQLTQLERESQEW
jgi:hypothetical protein